MSNSPSLRLKVPRHLQDFNGYCGPACALMVIDAVGSSKSPPVLAQNDFFRDIRTHAKATKDRRPIKSPSESLLALLNEHTPADHTWKKLFDETSEPVVKALIGAVDTLEKSSLILISKGMHWVVVFGRTLMDDGSVAGLLLRDPAWAGMPRFFGLSVFPDEPAITHCQAPCDCLNLDSKPGTVHERYLAYDELISPRGLQGSPDWEGKGAIALIPTELNPAALVAAASQNPSAPTATDPREAALEQIRTHGLVGRPDSPADWQEAMAGAEAGEPILVKDPDDPRDDFYLVPLKSSALNVTRQAWVMLDPVTLALREATLLDHWVAPAFPTESDIEKASQEELTLEDGTKHRFEKRDLKANQKNLVWKASAASILPYWPVRELTAQHPVTGMQTSIYLTQKGEVYSSLLPDDPEPSLPENPTPPESPPSSPLTKVLGATSLALAGAVAFLATKKPEEPQTAPLNEAVTLPEVATKDVAVEAAVPVSPAPESPSSPKIITVTDLRLEKEIALLKKENVALKTEARNWSNQVSRRDQEIQKLKREITALKSKVGNPARRIALLEKEAQNFKRQIATLQKEKTVLRNNNSVLETKVRNGVRKIALGEKKMKTLERRLKSLAAALENRKKK